MNEILVKSGVEIDLGKRGEHLARCIVFDISGWQKTYGEGSVHLLHQRNGDKAPYPCVVETDGPYVRWLLSETDVDVAGRGRAELQYFVDEARVKSETWNTRTNRSMNNEGPIPEEPAENWLNTMLQLGTETQENAEIAEQNAEIAEQSAAAAKASEESTAESERLAEDYKQAAMESAALATGEADRATEAKDAAEDAKDAAEASAQAAAEREQIASEAADRAEAVLDSVAVDEEALKNAVAVAEESAVNAATSASNAAQSENSAKNLMSAAAGSAQAAAASASDAAASESAAKAAQSAAEKARDEADALVGDFATKSEAQGYANAAEDNANEYTDQAISKIPAPDVSGEIGAHNTATDAHADIRSALAGKAASSHNHSASEITSGTLAVARGGTGNTSVDTTPTSGSTKMVTSGGVYTALAGKAASSHGNHVPTTQTASNKVFLRNDNTWQTVTPANIGAATTTRYTATVATSWTASGSYFYKDVSVSGILATDYPIVDINPGSDNAANALYSEAICKVFRITTSANSIRLWATENIATSFPIQLKVVR